MPIRTHYPGYSVLSEQHECDNHTRQIVSARLGPFGEPRALSEMQLETLRPILAQLTADDRPEIIDYLVDHLDTQISRPIGQAERKLDLPPFDELLPRGLEQIARYSQRHHSSHFHEMPSDTQHRLLQDMEQGGLGDLGLAPQHQREFFSQLLAEVISAYYSHPWVWSEIGYAGPAYPRGYLRVELGLIEPWEAKRHGE